MRRFGSIQIITLQDINKTPLSVPVIVGMLEHERDGKHMDESVADVTINKLNELNFENSEYKFLLESEISPLNPIE